MNELIFKLHTPEELRMLSSMAHWVVGYIFLAIIIISFLQLRGFLKNKQYLWSLLVIIAGLFFIPYILSHHGFNELPLVWQIIFLDPQQKQHFIMFNLLFVAGIVELLISLKKVKRRFWQFIFPGVLAIIGYLFLTHPQNGTSEAQAYTIPFHTALGVVLLLAGSLKAVANSWSNIHPWIKYAWIMFIFIASLMLITYSEPEDAYQMNPSGEMQHSNMKSNDVVVSQKCGLCGPQGMHNMSGKTCASGLVCKSGQTTSLSYCVEKTESTAQCE